jgi:hypothetical protein
MSEEIGEILARNGHLTVEEFLNKELQVQVRRPSLYQADTDRWSGSDNIREIV